MALPTIRRRLGKPESVLVADRLAGYPPLTADEIEGLLQRTAAGGTWMELEMARVIRQCPILQGDLVIKAHGGQVSIRRYVGVDMA